jgi:hypothetical protein
MRFRRRKPPRRPASTNVCVGIWLSSNSTTPPKPSRASPRPTEQPVEDRHLGGVALHRGRRHRGPPARRTIAVRVPADPDAARGLRLRRRRGPRPEIDRGTRDLPLPRNRDEPPADRPAGVGKTHLAGRARAGGGARRLRHLLHHRRRPRRPLPPSRDRRPWATTMRFFAGPTLLVVVSDFFMHPSDGEPLVGGRRPRANPGGASGQDRHTAGPMPIYRGSTVRQQGRTCPPTGRLACPLARGTPDMQRSLSRAV